MTPARMDVLQVVKGIHARVAENDRRREGADSLRPRGRRGDELTPLKAACSRLYEIRGLVGETPPAPRTVRARMGGHVVHLMQRALFWYTGQIRRFQGETAAAFTTVHDLIEQHQQTIEALREEIEVLQRRQALSEMDRRADTSGSGGQTHGGALPEAFLFALQDHFRGSEEHIAESQAHWLRTIESIATAEVSNGVWLDIGCGRGEWLSMAMREGREVRGIDTNPAQVEYCVARGLNAQRTDAIEYLSSVPEESLSVVTAFHVVEHLPMDVLLTLVAKIARALRPGGLCVMETPNAANLPMGAHHFWIDPTHQRPVPARLLEFIFRYCGLNPVERVELNSAPENHHLPYLEIDVIRQVDRELYGPRDYGLVGRRET